MSHNTSAGPELCMEGFRFTLFALRILPIYFTCRQHKFQPSFFAGFVLCECTEILLLKNIKHLVSFETFPLHSPKASASREYFSLESPVDTLAVKELLNKFFSTLPANIIANIPPANMLPVREVAISWRHTLPSFSTAP